MYTLLSYLWFILAILAPTVSFYGFYIRLEDYVLLIMLLFLLIKVVSKAYYFSSVSRIVYAFLFSFISIISFSSLYNLLVYNSLNLQLFLKELFRFVKYFGVYFAFSYFDSDHFYKFNKLIVFCTDITILIQIAQIFNLFNINSFLRSFYTQGESPFLEHSSYELFVTGYFRGGSVFLNYNVFGNFLLIPFSYVLSRLISCEDYTLKKKEFSKILSYSFQLLFILTGILITQSRTAFISAVSIFITFIIVKKRIRKKYLVGFFMFVLIGIFAISRFLNLQRIFKIIQAFIEPEGSGAIKYDLLKKVIEESSSGNFFIGHGLGQFFQVDFEYGYLIYFYGIVGLILYIFSMLLIIKVLSTYNTYESAFFIALIVSFLIFGLGATSFLNIRIFPIFLALLSTYIASLGNRKVGGNRYANPSV